MEEDQTIQFDQDCSIPYIKIQAGNQNIETYALLDTGAKMNVISFELYQKLSVRETIQESHQLHVASGQTISTLFAIYLSIDVQNKLFIHKFQVMPPQKYATPCILAIPWMKTHRVSVDLDTDRAIFKNQHMSNTVLSYGEHISMWKQNLFYLQSKKSNNPSKHGNKNSIKNPNKRRYKDKYG